MSVSCSVLDAHNGSAGGPVPRRAGFALPILAIFGRVGRTVPVSREHDAAMGDVEININEKFLPLNMIEHKLATPCLM